MHILVTGGAGYIGSHTVIELLDSDHQVTVVDNLSNSSKESIKRIETLTKTHVPLHIFDLQDKLQLRNLFRVNQFDAVIHFAGLKAVGESVQKALEYYRVNLDSSINLLETMDEFDVRQLVFSSSATVYGSAPVPYTETSPVGQGITNPYGRTKHMIEQIITDTSYTHPDNQFVLLRYFNPIGAHVSGQIGEDPKGIPNNLMPFISQVASGQRDHLTVFGDDYPTADGTCIRDYIHVVDLAKGHLSALENIKKGTTVYNLGSGQGTSVLELVNAFIAATGRAIRYVVAGRRAGDLPVFFANAQKAKEELNWETKLTIEDMCKDAWRWQSQNPNGYNS